MIISLLILGAMVLVSLVLVQKHLALWIQCRLSGCAVTIADLIGVSLRRQKPEQIVASLIRLEKKGVRLSFREIERHATAGGNVLRTAAAMIEQKKHNLGLTWEELCAMDLAGENPVDAVKRIVGETTET